jgi:hypothetical protein
MKTCSTCKETKKYEEFYRCSPPKNGHRVNRDGYRSNCKACRTISQKKCDEKHREKRISTRKAWEEKNKDKLREYVKAWKDKNREKVRKANRLFSRKRYYNNLERERQRCVDWRKNNSEKLKRSEKYSYEKYPEKIRARSMVSCAIKNGYLTRPDNCSGCDSNKGKIEAHHPDYSKPLEVVWLCRKCHMSEHRK